MMRILIIHITLEEVIKEEVVVLEVEVEGDSFTVQPHKAQLAKTPKSKKVYSMINMLTSKRLRKRSVSKSLRVILSFVKYKNKKIVNTKLMCRLETMTTVISKVQVANSSASRKRVWNRMRNYNRK